MEVEYESSPVIGQHEGEREQEVDPEHEGAGDASVAEGGFSFRPGADAGGDSEGEGEGEGEGEEDEQAGASKTAPKKQKPRQSLAEKQLGTTLFPISRIKRIVKADKELENMSNEAVFMVAVATEYFVKHFMEEGYTKARLEKRKIVNYKDLASVVARSEEFDFLKDVIPTPISMSEALERRKQKLSGEENPSSNAEDASFAQQTQAMNDEDLPPLAPSTNPLFPNAIMKRPPNTHAKTAIFKPAPTEGEGEDVGEGEIDGQEEGDGAGAESSEEAKRASPEPASAPVSSTERKKPRVSATTAGTPVTPKVVSGKSAPTPQSISHSHGTRAARRSLANTDVDMGEVNEVRSVDLTQEQGEEQEPSRRVSEAVGYRHAGGDKPEDERTE
ncbi:DNA polymerase epsilon p12 subunit [Kwoniella heveanensis BCC8398]|uniref:DNA polymerase epsilon p12 subunit n=1 Tax=Kwoniella heveanensis BCC8398 TaxID=1296120 RepID=A0A1B9GT71_9TREE|nr:DNA polymerase epsilon p12 subunit [Kwoniella heveanensis BCC8398]